MKGKRRMKEKKRKEEQWGEGVEKKRIRNVKAIDEGRCGRGKKKRLILRKWITEKQGDAERGKCMRRGRGREGQVSHPEIHHNSSCM